MFSKAAPQRLDLSATQKLARSAGMMLTKKVWLPKLAYDALPYFYLTAGFAAFFGTLYISAWFWVLPHYLLFSAAICQLAFVVMGKRRRHKNSDSTETQDTEPTVPGD